MHEKVLFQDLREKLVEVAGGHPNSRIVRVRVWVGPLSHVDPTTLQRAWAEIVQGTAAEGASLVTQGSADLDGTNADRVILSSVDLAPDEGPPVSVGGVHDGGRK